MPSDDLKEVQAVVAKEAEGDMKAVLINSFEGTTREIERRMEKLARRDFRNDCAIAAMGAMISPESQSVNAKEYARDAFRFANAMLAERDRRDAAEDAKEKKP
jgi:hypothetical protein